MVVSENEITQRKDVALKAALEAGKMLKDSFGQVTDIKAKSDRNLVSDLDLKADEIITAIIKENFEGDNILSEERPIPELEAGFTWIIDPIDGTHNYIRNIAIFGVSIGVAYEDKVVAGVIYMPTTNELYWAQKDKGAYCNDRRIRVSQRDINQATIFFDSSIRYKPEVILKSLEGLADKVFNVRMLGSTVRGLTYIAEGKAELEVEYTDQVWDYAAGLHIIEEAGGRVTDLKGNEWNINIRGYIASNGVIHDEVFDIVNDK
jgi:myo-inositol-1(or 4)-monophosphatase